MSKKNKKWKAGSLVELKSGGPAMVVRSFEDYNDNFTDAGEYECSWFSNDGARVHTNSFLSCELKSASEEALRRWHQR